MEGAALSATVNYDNAAAYTTITASFTNSAGVETDPGSVSCVVTDPNAEQTTYTYGSGGTITRTSTGNYALQVTTESSGAAEGLWNYVFIGTGSGVSEVFPGTFRVLNLTGLASMSQWYCGMEELKSRLSITDTDSDYEIQLAIQTVTDWITNYCGQHFYRVTETRTFQPHSIWELNIDPLVSDPDIVSSADVSLDYDGDGVYEVDWGAPGTNYMFKCYPETYNINAYGAQRPFNRLQILTSENGENLAGNGGFLPFVWPYTHLNRVQITATWGWTMVPPSVSQAALMLAVDMFKSKDAPWGVAGMGDLGVVKVQSNPWVVELLREYINGRRKVGV